MNFIEMVAELKDAYNNKLRKFATREILIEEGEEYYVYIDENQYFMRIYLDNSYDNLPELWTPAPENYLTNDWIIDASKTKPFEFYHDFNDICRGFLTNNKTVYRESNGKRFNSKEILNKLFSKEDQEASDWIEEGYSMKIID